MPAGKTVENHRARLPANGASGWRLREVARLIIANATKMSCLPKHREKTSDPGVALREWVVSESCSHFAAG